ncbi:MAG: RecX family transcriptional regulator [Anaerolineales bacterium]|nr:RecX family transcriptional regulator [Anaerolineales bacterium]
MKVTALKLQSRNKNRVNVELDGKFAFSLTRLEAARLRLGQELTEADIARLQEADQRERVHERALRLLAIRPRSEAEVRENLRRHKVTEALIEAEVSRLHETGLLNDEAFAQLWVENRATFRPRSRRALQAELKRKGISPELTRAALAGADDEASAYRLAAQRAQRLRGLPRPEFRRKLVAYLGRRGFDYEIVQPIVERVWTEMNTTED